MILRNKDSKLYIALNKIFLIGAVVFNLLFLINRDMDIYFNLGFLSIILVLFLIATKEVLAKSNKKGYLIYVLGSVGLLALILKVVRPTL